MPRPFSVSFTKMRNELRNLLSGPQLLAFLPALTLGAFWLGGEGALLLIALAMPVLFGLAGLYHTPVSASRSDGLLVGPHARQSLIDHIDLALEDQSRRGRSTTVFAVKIDGFEEIVARNGTPAGELVLTASAERIASVLRGPDCAARLGDAQFGISLCPMDRADLETMIQLASRIQTALSEPISLDRTTIYVTCSVGFCLPSRAPEATGTAMLDAALSALAAARAAGSGAIRAYAPEMAASQSVARADGNSIAEALEQNQIVAWFQPQLSTDTGDIVGFESLARWDHPRHGILPPADFLNTLVGSGLSERLGEVMLYHALSALRAWDRAGLSVATVGVNFSGEELRNPRLVDKIRWELDRFELSPKRLTVEILETVMAQTSEDTIIRNIKSLSDLGCLIDLDDFGTGCASITSIRRFAIGRIKIDRSFVTHVDRDRDQQAMVSAILTMAERLNIQTLAEGVESAGEHAMLAQLGCNHVQGFGIARPMPFEDTLSWIAKHREKLVKAPSVGRRAG